jgi:hypothetical protein
MQVQRTLGGGEGARCCSGSEGVVLDSLNALGTQDMDPKGPEDAGGAPEARGPGALLGDMAAGAAVGPRVSSRTP